MDKFLGAMAQVPQPYGTTKIIDIDETARTQSLDEPDVTYSKLMKLEPRFSLDGVHAARRITIWD